MACSFGLSALLDDVQDSHVLMDKTSTVQAVNKMGSMKSLDFDTISKELWNWAIERNNFLSASHIPGMFNEEAGAESRREDRISISHPGVTISNDFCI